MAALDYTRSALGMSWTGRAFGAVHAALDAVSGWNEIRQTRRALNALTDRELDDIGLIRGDIDDVSR